MLFNHHIITGQIDTEGHSPSSMMAELVAIWQALRKATTMDCENYVLFTDSMSGLLALKSNKNIDHLWIISNIQKMYIILKEQNKSINFMWVPSHIGIQGNEMVDQVASILQRESREEVPYHVIDVAPPPSIKDFKNYTKCMITKNWIKSINWGSRKHYSDMNPEYKAPNIDHMKRLTQIRIIHLRADINKLCSFRCTNLCSYCGENFSTEHYLLHCPHTSKYKDMLTLGLEPHQVYAPAKLLTALILGAQDAAGYPIIKDMVMEAAPKFSCAIESHQHAEYFPWYLQEPS